jgi:hypothetical protein
MTFAGGVARIGIAAALAVGGISHAYLYIHGYQHIPTIGTAFLAQASVSFAVAVLILICGHGGRRLAGRVRVVTHYRAFRVLRARMAAVAARGDQRGR